MCVCVSIPVLLFATPWTVAHQAPLSVGFSRQEYWSGLPVPSTGYLPDHGIKPGSPALRADSLLSEPPEIYTTFFFFDVLLIYDVVSISAVQPSDSVIHINTFFFNLFHDGHHILCIDPHAIH